ncbi:hypothetical protein ACHAPD_005476 [Fusarium lateritium]
MSPSEATLLNSVGSGADINSTLVEAVANIVKKKIEPWLTKRLDTAATELKTTVEEHFQWQVTVETQNFLHHHVPEIEGKIEPNAERIKSKLEPEITQKLTRLWPLLRMR